LTQRQALTQLEEALATIEDFEKVDYLRALKVAYKLVLTESELLRHMNFNKAAAARKLFRDWKRRREVFGDLLFLSTVTHWERGSLYR
jgi:hypothetical protein